MTAWKKDKNGFWTQEDVAITKAMVNDYLSEETSIKAVDGGNIVRLLRPPEELAKAETIESLKLKPFVNDHTFIGGELGVSPEQKGIAGTIGEKVYFDGEYLRANITVWSEKIKDLIDSGKVELSAGYMCDDVGEAGNFRGEDYDGVQRNICYNHIALVDEGRCGHEVRFLDKAKEKRFYIDNIPMNMKGKNMVDDKKKSADSKKKDAVGKEIEKILKKLEGGEDLTDEERKSIADACRGADEELKPDAEPDKEADEGLKPDMQDDDGEGSELDERIISAIAEACANEIMGDKKDDKKTVKTKIDKALRKAQDFIRTVRKVADAKCKAADAEKLKADTEPKMDAAKIAKEIRQDAAAASDLAQKLQPHIGNFDYRAMSCDEVALYGAKKLGIKTADAKTAFVAVNARLDGANEAQKRYAYADKQYADEDNDVVAMAGGRSE